MEVRQRRWRNIGEKGYVVKGDVNKVEEGMLRRMRVNARIHYCGRKVADLKIYLFCYQTRQSGS